MSTVISLRGTNGAGKSTMVRNFMERMGQPTRKLGLDGKLAGYMFTRTDTSKVFVLGRYETACGGLDATYSYPGAADDLCQDIVDCANSPGDVVCEGVVALSSYGIGRLQTLAETLKTFHHNIVFALLDTPEEICIERVQARRLAKGNLKPFDPANLHSKYEGIKKDQQRLAARGLDCCLVSNEDWIETLILRDHIEKQFRTV